MKDIIHHQELLSGADMERPDDESLVVPIECIHLNPRNSRTSFNEETIEEIAQSIRAHGIWHPLLVRSKKEADSVQREFEVICGDTRLLASQQAGLKNVPVRVRDVDNATARKLNLIENLHRQSLNEADFGKALTEMRNDMQAQLDEWLKSTVPEGKTKLTKSQIDLMLQNHGNAEPWVREVLENAGDRRPKVTIEVLAKEIGITPRHIYRLFDADNLPEELREQVVNNQIRGRQIRALTSLKTPEQQRQLAREIIDTGLNGDRVILRAREIKRSLAHPPKRQYGQHLNFRGLLHEPINEQGVVFLFGMLSKELGYTVESVQTGFPDCEAKRHLTNGKNKLEKVLIEFEYQSRNFQSHGHDASQCHLIVCWEHNWPECPAHLEVLELKSAIQQLNQNA